MEEEAGSEAEAEEEGEAGEQPTLLLRRRAEEPLGPEALPEARVRSLGLQAALHVLRSRRPLATLRDIAGNLPSLARPLSRLSLEGRHEEVRRALAEPGPHPHPRPHPRPNPIPIPNPNQVRRALEEPRRVSRLRGAAHGTLTLNGRPLPLDRPDAFFGVLSVLHEEAAAAARLLGPNLNPNPNPNPNPPYPPAGSR